MDRSIPYKDFSVRCKRYFSPPYSCFSEVPQGLCLGPSLFKLCIYDTANVLPEDIKLFADDVKYIIRRTNRVRLLLSM